jgi:tetratricopeptide (TPR) repeat protein
MEERSIMLPLEPLASLSPIERLILRARAPEAAAEIERLTGLAAADTPVATPPAEGAGLSALQRAALTYARGSLALREGSLAPAQADLEAASAAFTAASEPEAAELSRAEALLAKMRRGPRQAFAEAEAALAELAAAPSSARVRVVATHYRGAALRLLGDAQNTQRALLEALGLAEAHPPERPRILNSLGTLYVVLGAYGAAEALLEHAAELHHQRGDAVGEAIACGQLGAAALGLGDLAKARTWLQRQEWLASQVGDAFGRARALTFLADVALDFGRPDDALELANLARDVARSTTPPLAIWLAYATRAAGRAKADLGDLTAEAELRDARERFTRIGNPLGLSLTEWDLVRLGGQVDDGASGRARAPSAPNPGQTSAHAGEDGAPPVGWSGPAWALASLGLPARVAGMMRDHAAQHRPADAAARAAAEEAFFAVAQPAPHLGVPREIELVYEAPGVLGDVSNRRTAAQRNLARLGALTLAPPGLVIATIRWTAASHLRALPAERAACAAIGALPGTVQWAWPLATSDAEIERDLASLRAAITDAGGRDVTIELARHPSARVLSPPFAGEVAAVLSLGNP